MPKSIVILTSKDISIERLKELCLTYRYNTRLNKNNILSVEKDNNYILISVSNEYFDLAVEDYLEFDDLNEHKIKLIKNASFISMQFNHFLFIYAYLNDFFEHFKQYSDQILIDDDYGNLFTIEEFKVKYPLQ